MKEATERVARGAELLDRKLPDWWQRIDVETLDITSSYFCILGQQFPWENDSALGVTPYGFGLRQLQIEESVENGFTPPYVNWAQDAVALREAWIAIIQERQLMAASC